MKFDYIIGNPPYQEETESDSTRMPPIYNHFMDCACFDDPTKTFADLYMKSGLYITEIVKRLYRSEAMKKAIPDDKERVRHILSKQVYGMAPTRIIYLIATNYILGFDDQLKAETHNFVEADAALASKNDTLGEMVNKYFG